MSLRLSEEEILTSRVLAEKRQSNHQIGCQLGMDEGTVHYDLRRAEEGAEDSRRNKPELAESVGRGNRVVPHRSAG